MLTISQQPTTDVLLSGNDIVFRTLATDENGDRFRYVGARAELRVPAGATWQIGEYVIFYWTEPNGATNFRQFAVSDQPTDPVTGFINLPSSAGYPTALAYWEDMALRIGNDPVMRPLFQTYVTVDPVTNEISLWVAAKDYAEGWIIDVGPQDDTLTYTYYLYTDLFTNKIDGHRILMNVFLESAYDSMMFDRIAVIETVAGFNSEQTFNISEIIHSGIVNRLPDVLIPSWDTADPVILETAFKFYTQISEAANVDGFTPDSYTTSEIIALCGGVANSVNIPAYLEQLTLETAILTWRSKTQTIGYRQPYFLNYFISDNFVSFPEDPGYPCYVEVEEYDETNTLITSRYVYDTGFPIYDKNRIISFPVGVDALGIGGTTYYYRVRVMLDPERQGEVGSDWMTFYIDRRYYVEERYLAYLNSFHAPEVVRCTGTLTKQLNISQDVSQRVRTQSDGPSYAEQRNEKVSWEDIFTYNTHFMDARDADAVQHELRLAKNIYEISPAGYIPLRTTGRQFPISATRQNLHQLEINCIPTAINQFYSRIDGLQLDLPIDVWGSPDGIGIWASPLAQPWT